ncbi:MAG: hypothetical protein ACREJQ_00360, partial [bacterium]
HSLGTVVAYNALVKVLEEAPPDQDPRVRNLVTMAAPFNKIHALFGQEQDATGNRGAVVRSAAVRGIFESPAQAFAVASAPPAPGEIRWFNVTAAMESVGETIDVPVLKFYPRECFVVNDWNPLTTHNAYFENPELMKPLARLIAGDAADLHLPWKPYPYRAAEQFYWALLPVFATFLVTLPKTIDPLDWTPARAIAALAILGVIAVSRYAGPMLLLLLTALLTRAYLLGAFK